MIHILHKMWQHGLKDGQVAVAINDQNYVYIMETKFGDCPTSSPKSIICDIKEKEE